MENIRKQDETLVSNLTDSSVQRDKDQCLSRQTPVSVVTDNSVCQPSLSTTRKCVRCLRELPSSSFYTKDKRRTPDCYCKECRKTANRMRRKVWFRSADAEDIPPSYPVITNIEQREVRLQLILHALQMVRESAGRKCRKQHEHEYRHEDVHTMKPHRRQSSITNY
ncbi:hypothetical protein [Bacteroides sp.]|uniref:hypothetical protein n=1 Tax=Bacteroides sp. TaxID=29523 RepID=UPI003AB7D5DA